MLTFTPFGLLLLFCFLKYSWVSNLIIINVMTPSSSRTSYDRPKPYFRIFFRDSKTGEKAKVQHSKVKRFVPSSWLWKHSFADLAVGERKKKQKKTPLFCPTKRFWNDGTIMISLLLGDMRYLARVSHLIFNFWLVYIILPVLKLWFL